MQDDIIVDPMESPEIVDDPFQTIRANLTSADMRESDFSGSTFNGAYMEKVVTYKANFEGKLSYILEVEHCAENVRRIGTMG
ncbi:hypothetical protein ACFX1R_032221 [Malus domestica]